MSIERRFFGRAGAMLVVALMLAPLLAACGAEATPTPVPPTEAPVVVPTDTAMMEQATPTEVMAAESPTAGGAMSTTLKVGLVTDVGRLNDKSFNQSSWEGVQQAQKDLGVDAKPIETTDPKD